MSRPDYLSKTDIFAATSQWQGELTSVKHSHLGPRGKRSCIGGEVRIAQGTLPEYNRGQEVDGFCAGCGYRSRSVQKG